MYLSVEMPESRYYEAYLDGKLVKSARAADEEGGWVDYYIVDENNRLIQPIHIERRWGRVELRKKEYPFDSVIRPL